MDKTLLVIFDEGSVKLNSVRGTHDTVYEMNQFVTRASMQCKEFGKLEGIGKSAKKKISQHLAAGDLLLKVFQTPYWEQFPIKAANADEAKQFVKDMIGMLQREGEVVGANPIGSLQTVCNQKALPEPVYSFGEFDMNTKVFKATVSVGKIHEATGQGANKKQAKAASAEAMLQLLEDVVPVKEFPCQEMDENFAIANTSAKECKTVEMDATSSDPDIMKMITEVIEDNKPNACSILLRKLFEKKVIAKILKHECCAMIYKHQSINPEKFIRTMQVLNKPVHEHTNVKNAATIIFSGIGIGVVEEDAINDAARSVLLYFLRLYEDGL